MREKDQNTYTPLTYIKRETCIERENESGRKGLQMGHAQEAAWPSSDGSYIGGGEAHTGSGGKHMDEDRHGSDLGCP